MTFIFNTAKLKWATWWLFNSKLRAILISRFDHEQIHWYTRLEYKQTSPITSHPWKWYFIEWLESLQFIFRTQELISNSNWILIPRPGIMLTTHLKKCLGSFALILGPSWEMPKNGRAEGFAEKKWQIRTCARIYCPIPCRKSCPFLVTFAHVFLSKVPKPKKVAYTCQICHFCSMISIFWHLKISS